MAHGILETDTMFSVKERPWHGLGKVIQTAPTIEEGLKEAGLDWEVKLTAISTKVGGQHVRIPGKKAAVRCSDNSVLGVVGENYSILQNTDAFKFFEPFVDEGLVTLETAGSLFNGRKVWILAKASSEIQEITKADGDAVENFILLSNAHDGTMAVRVGFTPVRVVCNNTLTFAEESKLSKLIRVRHSGNVVETLENIRETMDMINQQFLATVEQYKELAQKPVVKSDIANYVKQVMSPKKQMEQIVKQYESEQEEKEAIEKERTRLIKRVEEIFELEPARTAWNLYNSVNYYLNHESGQAESRYNSLWFGNNKKRDARALQLAMEL